VVPQLDEVGGKIRSVARLDFLGKKVTRIRPWFFVCDIIVRYGAMKLNQFSHIRWGEALAFLTILIVGVVIFVIQFWTWAKPQLTLYQEFVPARGIILDKRVVGKIFGTEIRYRPEVLLEHSVEGKNYRVWTFEYHTLQPRAGFTAEKTLAEHALEPFTIGRRTNCWYRINYPDQAIVVWQNSIWGWFLLLLSFSLIVIGSVGLPQSFRLLAVSKEHQAALLAVPKHPSRRTPDWQSVPDIRSINESPGTHLSYRLPLGHRPIFPLVGQTLFASAWTVIALVVLSQSFFEPSNSWTDYLLSILFRGLFCGVGIALFYGVARQLWITFRVAPTLLELSDHPVCPNRKYRILLHQDGTLQFQELTVDVVCEEIARFHQGTDTVTNRQDVFRQTLFSRADFSTTPDSPLHEEFFLHLPEEAMHSFRWKNNEVAWKLEFAAKLVGWAELRRDCPIVVRPGLFSDHAMESGVYQ
jgi:hypothetical protein